MKRGPHKVKPLRPGYRRAAEVRKTRKLVGYYMRSAR